MHKKILLVILLSSSFFAVLNLNDRPIWGDEAHLLFLSRSIIKYGWPVVDNDIISLDGVYQIDNITKNIKNDVQYTLPLFGYNIYRIHPWAVSYIAAIPIAIFGPYNEFFIRLPFVLIGLLAIPIVYFLSLRITSSKRTALIASLLLAGSTVYLLALRNANYYGLILFLTPAMLLSYMKWVNSEKHARWQFILLAIMLFHSQWLVFIGTMLGICVHFLLFNRHLLKRMIILLAGIFLFTFPWVIMTKQFNNVNQLSTPLQYLLLLSISIYHFILWFIPLLLLIFVPFLLRKNGKWNSGYVLLTLTIIMSWLFTALNYYTGTPIRYFYGLLPLAMILNASIINKIWNKKIIAIILLILIMTTNIVHVLPLMPFKNVIESIAGLQKIKETEKLQQIEFVNKTLKLRLMLWEYLHEVTNHVRTVTSEILKIIPQSTKEEYLFKGAVDGTVISYYRGLKGIYGNKFDNKRYDWLILFPNDKRTATLKNYNSIHIPFSAEKWATTADPVHHLFRTKIGEGINIYRKN